MDEVVVFVESVLAERDQGPGVQANPVSLI